MQVYFSLNLKSILSFVKFMESTDTNKHGTGYHKGTTLSTNFYLLGDSENTVPVTTFRCPYRRTLHHPAMTICLRQAVLLPPPLDLPLPQLLLDHLRSSSRPGQEGERTQTAVPSFQSCSWMNRLQKTPTANVRVSVCATISNSELK